MKKVFTSKLFIFSKTDYVDLQTTFFGKKIIRVNMKIPSKRLGTDVCLALYNFVNRFDYGDFDFKYAYLIADSTEQQRMWMALQKNESDYIALINDGEDYVLLNMYSELLKSLTDGVNYIDDMKNNALLLVIAVGLSYRKLEIRLNKLQLEIENDIEKAIDSFDKKFKI